jgi:hypothetical protein
MNILLDMFLSSKVGTKVLLFFIPAKFFSFFMQNFSHNTLFFLLKNYTSPVYIHHFFSFYLDARFALSYDINP